MQSIFVVLRPELLTILISWYIVVKTWKIRGKSENLYFFFVYAVGTGLFTVANFLASASDEKIAFTTRPGGFAVNFLYMVSVSCAAFTWFHYEENVLHSTWMNEKKKRMLAKLPIVIFIVLCLMSWKNGWIFTVDDNGTYYRGSKWFLQFFFAYSYLLVAFGKCVICALGKGKDTAEKRAYKTLIANSVIVLIGCVGQIIYGHSYVAMAAMVGLVVSYVELCTTEEREILEQQATAALLEETKRQKKALQEALDNYKQADYDRRTDFLTGLWNRQDMFDLLKDALSGKREEITAMYMMDIDNFKHLNDTYGHTYGDTCLKKIGSALKEYGKKQNIIFYRYGGEEMIGIGFGAKESAPARAEELVQLISDLKIVRDDVPKGVVTISLGYTTNNRRYEKMIDMADVAMYKAKAMGKDRAVCYEDIAN